jgi:hypothetical protein
MTRRLHALLEVMVFKIFVHHQLLNTSESTNRGASWNGRFLVDYYTISDFYTVPLMDGLATQKLSLTIQHETFRTSPNDYGV